MGVCCKEHMLKSKMAPSVMGHPVDDDGYFTRPGFQMMLDYTKEIDCKDINGLTQLFKAVQRGHVDQALHLIEVIREGGGILRWGAKKKISRAGLLIPNTSPDFRGGADRNPQLSGYFGPQTNFWGRDGAGRG